MSAMISLSRTTSDAKVNVNVKNEVKLGDVPQAPTVPRELNPYDEVHYAELDKLKREVEFLRTYAHILNTNAYKVMGDKKVLSKDMLYTIIKQLTGADDITFEVISEAGCLKTDTKITSIYEEKDGVNINMKYNDPDNYRKLSELGISTKYLIL